uniref:Putative secreted protein n=1 Tax=Anopheles darlingi TaxID=43151 RepID=A0A2M4DJE0_ANODA
MQYLPVAPARIARLFPFVIVTPVAAGIDEIVDQTRAPQSASLWPVADATLQTETGTGARIGLIAPVIARNGCDSGRQWYLGDHVAFLASFQQQHTPIAHLRQPVSHYRTTGTGTDNDEIVLLPVYDRIRNAIRCIPKQCARLIEQDLYDRVSAGFDRWDNQQVLEQHY